MKIRFSHQVRSVSFSFVDLNHFKGKHKQMEQKQKCLWLTINFHHIFRHFPIRIGWVFLISQSFIQSNKFNLSHLLKTTNRTQKLSFEWGKGRFFNTANEAKHSRQNKLISSRWKLRKRYYLFLTLTTKKNYFVGEDDEFDETSTKSRSKEWI